VTLGDYFDGETPVVLVLAYVRCETLCNLVLRGVAEAVHQSRLRLGKDYRVVTVSIDPRESPSDSSALRDALLELAGQGPDGRWDYLTGDDAAIRTLADELGFGYRWDQRTKQFSHPAVVFVLNGDGHIMRYLYGIRFPDAQLDAAILGAARNEAAPTSQGSSPLACFRFDPSLRAHWAAVARYFAVGGLLLIVVVGGGIGLLIRKERRERE
jgi:protein SCO1/2